MLEKSGGVLTKSDVDCFCRILMLETDDDFFGKNGVDLQERILAKKIKEVCASEAVLYLNLTPQQSIILLKDRSIAPIEFANKLLDLIKEEYENSCTASISSEISCAEQIICAMDELEELMENKFYHPNVRLFYSGMKSSDCEIIKIDDDTLIKQIGRASCRERV